jgi:uncharacterized protein YwqG
MINEDAVNAFNNRLTANLNNIKTMTPAQLDRVKDIGSRAENLLKNKDFAQFVHSFKFEICDSLVDIKDHTAENNANRVALSNQLSGIDSFIASLQRAVYLKNRVVTQQTPGEPNTDN